MLSRAADAISVQPLGSRNSNAETKNYIVHSKVSFWILQLQRLKAQQFFFLTFFFTAEEIIRFTATIVRDNSMSNTRYARRGQEKLEHEPNRRCVPRHPPSLGELHEN